MPADEAHDLLVDLADEHHLGDLHGRLVGHPVPVDEPRLHAEPLHVPADLGAAAVHDDRLHADEAQQHDVLGELLAQTRRGHRRAAVLDHHGRAPEPADVRHRLEQRLDRLLVRHGHVEYSALRVT